MVSLDWSGAELIQSRFTKSAAALAGIAKAISKNPALAAQHRSFLELFEEARGFEPEFFGRVWTDPTAYYWVRIAYDLLANKLSRQQLPPLASLYSQDVAALGFAEPLEAVLAEFQRFVLALRYLKGSQGSVARFPGRFPQGLPGTLHSITADGSISSVPCAQVSYGGFTLRLQPAAFQLPAVGISFAAPAIASSDEFQQKHAPVVQRTLEMIDRFAPARFKQFAETMQLAALKLRSSGTYTNMSHSHFPGAMIIGVVDDPFEMGDTFIHELHHNRLFFIEEQAPFFTDQNEESEERIYSPFRDDLRPIIGLFHAVYVYLPVTEYWFEVFARGASITTSAQREYAIDRALRGVLQIELAIAQLEKFSHFTAHGTALFEAMKKSAQVLRARASNELPQDAPAKQIADDGRISDELSVEKKAMSIREAVREHLSRFDVHRQVSGPFPG